MNHLSSNGNSWPDLDWPSSFPANLNIDPCLPELLSLAAAEAPNVTGIVVIRYGHIAAEHWADGWSASAAVDIRSCTKSLLSALVGTALMDGLLPDLSITIGNLIPDRIPNNADPAVAEITLWSLLTITSGLQWDGIKDYERLEAADNPVTLTLSQPIVAPQGESYAYNSGGSHIIGLMVASAAKVPLEDYAANALFEPLGMSPANWRRTPQGEVIGGYGLTLRPADMARFGYLYLRNGLWHNTRLIATEYVRQSTTVQSAGDPRMNALYGYQWWISNRSGHNSFIAIGYGGNSVYVVPELDLIVVTAVGDIDVPLYPPRPIIESTVIPLVYPD